MMIVSFILGTVFFKRGDLFPRDLFFYVSQGKTIPNKCEHIL